MFGNNNVMFQSSVLDLDRARFESRNLQLTIFGMHYFTFLNLVSSFIKWNDITASGCCFKN